MAMELLQKTIYRKDVILVYKVKPGRNLWLAETLDWEDLMVTTLNIQKLVEQDKNAWMDLYITSYGGNVDIGFALYEFIRQVAKPKLQTVILRKAGSMAIVVALAGTHRIISRSGVFVFHDASQNLAENSVIGRKSLKMMSRLLDKDHDNYVKTVSQRSKLTCHEVQGLMQREEIVDAKTALKFGLVHEIIK